MRYITFFLFLLLQAIAAYSQPTLVPVWDSDTAGAFQNPPFSSFKAIGLMPDGRWLLAGRQPGKGIFLTRLDATASQPDSLRILHISGQPTLNAIFPDIGCWLAGQAQHGKRLVPWLAHLNAIDEPDFDQKFEAQQEGEFFDLLVTRHAVLAVGQLDGRLAVAMVKGDGIPQICLNPSGNRSAGRALTETTTGDILIAGFEEDKKSRRAVVWQFEPASGRFSAVHERPMSEGLALCKGFYGEVFVAGTGQGADGAGAWVLCLKKSSRPPAGAAAWQKASEAVIPHNARMLELNGILQAPDLRLLLTGSSYGSHPLANAPQAFALTLEPSLQNAPKKLPFLKEHPDGSAALALARSAGNEFLLAGYAGVSEKKGKGRLLRLRVEEVTPLMPGSGLDSVAMPPMVFSDELDLDVPMFRPEREESPFPSVKYTLNGSRKVDAPLLLRPKDTGWDAPVKIIENPQENACCEYRLLGKLPLERGKENTFQIIDESHERFARSPVQTIYSAPALYVVAIGNNNDGLRWAEKDAKDFCETLKKEKGRSFRDVRVVLLNKAADIRRDKVAAIMDDTLRSFPLKKGDLFVFFMSSHCREQEGRLVFPCHKSGEIIRFDADIFEKIERLRCRKLIFLDACQNSPTNTLPTIPQSPDVFMALACEPGKQSFESDHFWQGLFTKALLEALAAGYAKTFGFTSPGELFRYIQPRVQELKKEQVPQSPDGENLQDIPFIYRTKR